MEGGGIREWLARRDPLIARVVGESGPAPRPRLSLATAGLIVALLAVWRAAIFGFSSLLDRLGETNCGWGTPGYWKYSACWDTNTYQLIAARGYDYAPDTPSAIAFFPLYPLIMRYADRWLPGPGDVKASLLVTHAALLLAVFYVYLAVRALGGERDADEPLAWRTLVFMLAFPSAMFYAMAYPEALFLLAVAGSLYHARRGQWLLAAGYAAFGSAAKLVGVLLVVPLAIEMLTQRALPWMRRASWQALPALLLAPMGLVAYFGWLHARWGSFTVFFEAQENWRRGSRVPVVVHAGEWLAGDRSVADRYYGPDSIAPFAEVFLLADAALLVLFIVAGAVLWRTVRPSYGALVAVIPLALLFSGNPQSMNRYVAVLFPAFILLARIRSEPLRDVLLLVFTVGLALETYLFVNALWAG